MLDKDSDGKISLEEFKHSFGFQSQRLSSSHQVLQNDWEEIDTEFKKIAKVGSTKIDFKEFKDHMILLESKGRYDRRPDFMPRLPPVILVPPESPKNP